MTRAKKIQDILKPKKVKVLPIFGDINSGVRIESSDPRKPIYYLRDDDDDSEE